MSAQHRITTVALTAVGAAAVGLAALATAGTAAASTADDTFLAQMKSVGVTFTTATAGVQEGHQVCKELAAGSTGTQIQNEILSQTNLTSKQAAYFVVYATKDYCPQYSDGLS
jgi:Zn-dependent alcohol dehydrogenase